MKIAWRPIEKEPKSIRKGFMRLYTFAPTEKEHPNDYVNRRMYFFAKGYGSRVCDAYIDIPLYKEE